MGSPCDTLSVGVEDNVPEQELFFQAWYNSEWNMIHVNASKLKGRTGSLRLFDLEGRLVFEKKVEVIAGGYVTGEIPMNAVANGVYLVNLITDSESVSSKVVKF
ncbi:MAG: T9SS type A sorting domain-containing protein [Bacteroidetes bacterium]|nr:T9SS type A sorting domain-containing protein [Bacteroidota bacterium]